MSSRASLRPLVYRLLNPLSFVAFKMGRLQGARKEHIKIDTGLTSNEAADPFSTQPFGLRRNSRDLGDGTLVSRATRKRASPSPASRDRWPRSNSQRRGR